LIIDRYRILTLFTSKLDAHSDIVLAVDASQEREFIATGGMEKDKTVKFWVPSVIEE
jgi:hypothetical protein